MTVKVNGLQVPLEAPITIQEFLIARNLPPRSVVVEHNGEAVAPSQFHTKSIQPGDTLEIVQIVAGG